MALTSRCRHEQYNRFMFRTLAICWMTGIALLPGTPASAQQSAGTATQDEQTTNSPITNIQVECVPAYRASELQGEHGCVAGKVSRITTPKNGGTHISLCPHMSGCAFHAVVRKQDHDAVGDLTYLRGKLVAFDGDVKRNRGWLEIVVKKRSQVHVAAGNSPREFDAAQAKPKDPSSGKQRRTW